MVFWNTSRAVLTVGTDASPPVVETHCFFLPACLCHSLDDYAHAAIGHDDGADDEAGLIGCQEGYDFRDFLGLCRAFDRSELAMLC